MSETTVKLGFTNEFEGTLTAKNGAVKVGKGEGMLAPYELLLGALGGCFYSTFLGIARKMRLEFDSAAFSIHGVKREEVPTTLKTVDIVFTIRGAKGEKGFQRAAELAAKHCSVHETLSKVAEMSLRVVLE
ncbi:MAG: OsmC family protein [Clostridiales bacterium]|nr:OsmC family protein [Clostridiales bacterium]